MKRNPFFNRQRIIDPAYFFGRRTEVDVLYSAIFTHQCRALVAERKLGKSSLLTYISNPGVMQSYGLDPARQFLLYFGLEALSSAGPVDFWLEVLEMTAGRLPEGEARSMILRLADGGEVRFMNVRRALRQLRNQGYDLALCLDEFEALATNPRFEPDFYGELRSLASELGLVYITASKRSLYELTYENSETLSSPFFNIFSELPLGILPEEDAHALLAKLSALDGSGFCEDEVQFATILSGCHPFFLQIAGYHLYAVPGCGSPRAKGIYQMVHKHYMAEAEDHYRYLWSQLSSTQQMALLHLTQASEPVIRTLRVKALVKDEDSRPVPFSETFGEFLDCQRSEEETSLQASAGAMAAAPGEAQEPDLAGRAAVGDLIGKTLGGYRVVCPVGQGGMAEVYKGYHAALDRYVALKVLSPHFAADPQFNERFQREATAVARLRHPNIVQVYDYGSAGASGALTYMVMEFVGGPTLKEKIRGLRAAGERVAVREALTILRQVASALDYAHTHGLVHRDVKPANILLRANTFEPEDTSEPYAVLTDFGIVKMMEGVQFTATGTTLGTPDYMSPEQARSDEITPASDIYSLGIVAYELLVGQLPFAADTPLSMLLKHLRDAPDSPRLAAPELPQAAEDVLMRALAKQPADRYSSACAMVFALENAL